MADTFQQRQVSLLRWGLTALIFALDCMSPPYVMVPFFYALVLFLGKADKRAIWTLAVVGMALTIVAPLIGVTPMPGYPERVYWLNRLLAIVELLIGALLAGKR